MQCSSWSLHHPLKAHADGGCLRGSALAVYRYSDNIVYASLFHDINGIEVPENRTYPTQMHLLSSDSNDVTATCDGVRGYDVSESSLPYPKVDLYGLVYTTYDADGFAKNQQFFYTVDSGERQNLLNGGWQAVNLSGVQVYSPEVGPQVPNAVAVHRLYNGSNGDHLYSTNAQEISTLLNAPNTPWQDEHVAFYLLGTPDPALPAN